MRMRSYRDATRRTNVRVAERVAREHEQVVEEQLARRSCASPPTRGPSPPSAGTSAVIASRRRLDLQRLARLPRRLATFVSRAASRRYAPRRWRSRSSAISRLDADGRRATGSSVGSLRQRLDVADRSTGARSHLLRRPLPRSRPRREPVVALMQRGHDLTEVLRRHAELDGSRDDRRSAGPSGSNRRAARRSPPLLEVDRLADLVEHLEARRHADCQAVLGEQPAGERVQRRHRRVAERGQRPFDERARRPPSSSSRTRTRSSAAAFSVNVIAAIWLMSTPALDQCADAVDEDRRLAGAGARLDEQRVVRDRSPPCRGPSVVERTARAVTHRRHLVRRHRRRRSARR